MARKPTKSRLKEYVWAGALSFLLVWLVVINVSIFRKEEIAQGAADDTQKQLAALQTRESSLEQNINELSTERGQEATLRETFGVAKPGEGVIGSSSYRCYNYTACYLLAEVVWLVHILIFCVFW
jgi:cell division protein FtsB